MGLRMVTILRLTLPKNRSIGQMCLLKFHLYGPSFHPRALSEPSNMLFPLPGTLPPFPLVNFSLWEPPQTQCVDLSSFCSLKGLYFNTIAVPILLSDLVDYFPIHTLHYMRYTNLHQVQDWHQSFSPLLSHHPPIY